MLETWLHLVGRARDCILRCMAAQLRSSESKPRENLCTPNPRLETGKVSSTLDCMGQVSTCWAATSGEVTLGFDAILSQLPPAFADTASERGGD